jgi:hypothetical protein
MTMINDSGWKTYDYGTTGSNIRKETEYPDTVLVLLAVAIPGSCRETCYVLIYRSPRIHPEQTGQDELRHGRV